MKKYFSGIVALIMAFGFSAFTQRPVPSGKNLTNLYWYRTNAAGTGLISYLGFTTKAAVITSTGCDDTDFDFCARGYTSPQSLGTAPIPSPDLLMDKQ
jgi:hypothetical protein